MTPHYSGPRETGAARPYAQQAADLGQSDEAWVSVAVPLQLLSMKKSAFYQRVASADVDRAAGKPAAPQPVIRGHRFTRWRLGDIRRYQAELIEYAARTQTGASMLERTARARAALAAKRQAGEASQTAGA